MANIQELKDRWVKQFNRVWNRANDQLKTHIGLLALHEVSRRDAITAHDLDFKNYQFIGKHQQFIRELHEENPKEYRRFIKEKGHARRYPAEFAGLRLPVEKLRRESRTPSANMVVVGKVGRTRYGVRMDDEHKPEVAVHYFRGIEFLRDLEEIGTGKLFDVLSQADKEALLEMTQKYGVLWGTDELPYKFAEAGIEDVKYMIRACVNGEGKLLSKFPYATHPETADVKAKKILITPRVFRRMERGGEYLNEVMLYRYPAFKYVATHSREFTDTPVYVMPNLDGMTIAASVIRKYATKLRRCPRCARLFIRNGRSKYCSSSCGVSVRVARLLVRRAAK